VVSINSSASVTKRKASATLERESVKKARASSEESGTSDESATSMTSPASHSEVEYLGAHVAARTIENTEQSQGLSEMEGSGGEVEDVQTLKDELEEAQEDRDELQGTCDALQLRVDALEATKNAKNPGAFNKKFEELIKKKVKEEFEIKLKAEKAKHTAGIKKVHAACQKRIDVLKAEHVAAQKAKDDKLNKKGKANRVKCIELVRAAKQELANAKNEHAALKIQLKAEQQAEIDKYRPGFSQTFKERDQEIANLRRQRVATAVDLGRTRKEVEEGNEKLEHAETLKDALEGIVGKLRGSIDVLEHELSAEKACSSKLRQEQQDLIDSAQTAKAEGKKAIERRLDSEGQRWQLQYEKAENLGFKLVDQQRSNFALKGMLTGRDKRMATLSAAIVELKDVNTAQEKRIRALVAEVSELQEDLQFNTPMSNGGRHEPSSPPDAAIDASETAGLHTADGSSNDAFASAAENNETIPGAALEQMVATRMEGDEPNAEASRFCAAMKYSELSDSERATEGPA